MYCPQCGSEVDEGTTTCPACDASIVPVGTFAGLTGGATPPVGGPPAAPSSSRAFMASFLLIFALILILVSMATLGWYEIRDTEGQPGDTVYYKLTFNAGLSSVELKSSSSYMGGTPVDESQKESYEDFFLDLERSKDVVRYTKLALWPGVFVLVILILISLSSVSGRLFRVGPPAKPTLLLVSLILLTLLLIGLIYFGSAFPTAIEKDLEIGEEDKADLDKNGLDWAYFTAFFAIVLVLVAMLMFLSRRDPYMYPAAPWPPASGAGAPPQQPY